jgi:hypothetical protein
MVAPLCGPGWWRSILVNLAPSLHRMIYLYQLIKEKFILRLPLRFMQFSLFSCLPLTLTPTWSFYPCAVLEARIELLGCVSTQDLSFTGRKGSVFWGPTSGKRTCPQWGPELCSRLA